MFFLIFRIHVLREKISTGHEALPINRKRLLEDTFEYIPLLLNFLKLRNS